MPSDKVFSDTPIDAEDTHTTITTTLWPHVGTPSFVHPELTTDTPYSVPMLQAKPEFAICLSGGSLRAASSALGWVSLFHACFSTATLHGTHYVLLKPLVVGYCDNSVRSGD